MILKTFRNFEKFPFFKGVKDPLWSPNGNSRLAKEHTASINRRNTQLLFFKTCSLCPVTSFLG